MATVYWIHMNNRGIFFFISVTIVFFGVFPALPTQGAIRDSDFDGLSDEAEQTMYMTDPAVADTDNDGIFDGAELLARTNPLDSASSQLTNLSLSEPGLLGDPTKFMWYIGRASGIFAFIMLTIVVCFGLLMNSRFIAKFFLPATIPHVYRFLLITVIVAVIVHASSFFFGDSLHLSIAEALVPFFLARDYTSALGFDIGKTVGLGIIAFYFMLLLAFVLIVRSKMSPNLWRIAHVMSLIAYILAIGHGIMSGTDSTERWMQALYTISALFVSGLVFFRLYSNIFSKILAPRPVKTPESLSISTDSENN